MGYWGFFKKNCTYKTNKFIAKLDGSHISISGPVYVYYLEQIYHQNILSKHIIETYYKNIPKTYQKKNNPNWVCNIT